MLAERVEKCASTRRRQATSIMLIIWALNSLVWVLQKPVRMHVKSVLVAGGGGD